MLSLAFIFILISCSSISLKKTRRKVVAKKTKKTKALKKKEEWGQKVTGVKTKLDTKEKVIALTFDICEGEVDTELVNFLKANNIKATIFVSHPWLKRNISYFKEHLIHENFLIANHGTRHIPLSIDGKSAYEIKGTSSRRAIIHEIKYNERKIASISRVKPTYFRSGTNHYDDTSVKLANKLGVTIVGHSILGDGGGTFSNETVQREIVRKAFPGAIVLLHMNKPESGTFIGLKAAIQRLKKKGYNFVNINEYKLK